jgi:Ca2+ transporting ATPase
VPWAPWAPCRVGKLNVGGVVQVWEEMGGPTGVCEKLMTSTTSGIRSSEKEERQEKFGRNYVEPPPLTPFWQFCLDAMEDPTLQFLCCAAIVSLLVGSIFEAKCLGYLDGIAILVAVMVVVFVGAAQESAKQRQFRSLTDSASDELVNVVRDGQQMRVSNRDIVVGDCVVLSTGDILCADGIIFERNTLKIFEGALTGESHAIIKGNYEFKEKGAFSVPNDTDLTQMNVPGDTPEQRAAKYEPTPEKTPLVFKGTEVQDGEGRMIVIGVGLNTYENTLLGDKGDDDDDESGGRSIMQRKLDDMTILITKVGAIFGIGIIIILFIRFGILFGQKACCKEEWDHTVHHLQWIKFFIIGITIFVVAVPEGLPLAVTIALAFSVKKMMTDQNMVKTSSACETMGSATTICSDKTGTLTTSMMTVMRAWVGGEQLEPKEVAAKVSEKLKNTIMAAMTINTSDKTDIVAKTMKKMVDGKDVEEVVRLEGKVLEAYSGNATECAMIKMVNVLGNFTGDAGSDDMPYKKFRREFPETQPGRSGISFSSKRKRMSTLVPMPDGSEAPFMLYTKGASEMVMALCNKYMNADGQVVALDDAMRKNIDDSIVQFADQGLRTISVACKPLDASPANADGALPDEVEADLILVAVVGIEDPLREEVPGAIATCRKAGITVRMVTGDNLATAKAISRKAGILSEEGERSGSEIAMTGEQFRSRVLSEQEAEHPEKHIIQEEFDQIWPKLRVLARSTPTDKLVLVMGIQKSRIQVGGFTRQVVAVTGDGTNDAPALKQADVGFAMYINGTQVAQQAADIVILDDNFQSIVAAVKWGRCVYDNICKFLQFQLTVNITACTLAFLGAAVLTESPIGVIQLLWVNLIMDSFASLALATEDPNRVPGLKEQLLNRYPYQRTAPLLSKIMVRNMIFHSIWQLAILLTLIFAIGDVCEAGESIDVCAGTPYKDMPFALRSGRPSDFDLELVPDQNTCVPKFDPEKSDSYYLIKSPAAMAIDASGLTYQGYVPLRSKDYCQEVHGCGVKSQHYTIIFNVFVFLQVFNEINARKIHNEWNMFQGILYNDMFLAVVIGTIIVQIILVQVPGVNTAFGCTGLDAVQWLICLSLGFTSIPINFIVKMMPYEWIPLGSWAGGLDESAIDEVLPRFSTQEAFPYVARQLLRIDLAPQILAGSGNWKG